VNLNRRAFFAGLAAALAAPAVASSASLMRLRGVKLIARRIGLQLVSSLGNIAAPAEIIDAMEGDAPPDLFTAMMRMIMQVPITRPGDGDDLRFQMSPDVITEFARQANSLNVEPYFGTFIGFRGVPFEVLA
jgi:hypothetical protein